MKTLKIGVIGLGIGEMHARAYQGIPDCQVAMLCDSFAERLSSVGLLFPSAKLTQTAEDIIHSDELDVVSIASYDDAHFEQALACLQSGKHAFVEKPLCRSIEEICGLLEICRANPQLVVRSNLVLRAAPVYCWLRDAVQQGQFGKIYAFDGDYLYGRLSKITEGWRKDIENYSVMQGGGIHMVDLMLWVTSQRPASVTAVGNRVVTDGTNFKYDDFVAATFHFPSGMVGRITANFGCVHPHQHVVRVFGTRGTFVYDDKGPRVYTSTDPDTSPTQLDLSPFPPSKGSLIPPFVQAIREGGSSGSETQHEFDTIRVCVAADEAAKAHAAVEIQP